MRWAGRVIFAAVHAATSLSGATSAFSAGGCVFARVDPEKGLSLSLHRDGQSLFLSNAKLALPVRVSPFLFALEVLQRRRRDSSHVLQGWSEL